MISEEPHGVKKVNTKAMDDGMLEAAVRARPSFPVVWP